MNINVFILMTPDYCLLIESVGFPDATADETAEFLATGVDPTKELLLYLPCGFPDLDVLFQRRGVPIRRAAVIDEVEDGIVSALRGDALALIGHGLEFLQVFTQELLGLVLGDLVALLHASRMAEANRPHTDAILIGRQSHALEFLNGCNQCAAGSHTISFDGSMSAVAVPEGTGLSGRMVFSISSHSAMVTRTRFLHLRSPH